MKDDQANLTIERAAARTRAMPDRAPKQLTGDLQKIFSGIRPAVAAEIVDYNARMEKRRLAETVAQCHLNSKVPQRYRAARLNDANMVPGDCQQPYYRAAGKLATALQKPGIYALIGEIGDGKTHLACALINEFCETGRSAKYLKCADYIRDLRANWDGGHAGGEAAYEAAHVRLSLLVLDEWQVRGETVSENNLLLRLIDKRYDDFKATVIIANYPTKEEFEKSIDGRIADRLCDGGGMIICDWPSLRGRLIPNT